MKKALFLVLCAGFLNTAMAKDSTWLMCVGDVKLYDEDVKLAVNVYEHRNSTGDGRETDLTLIYGGNVLQGSFNSTENDSGVTILKQNTSFYRGSAAVDYSASTLSLSGRLNLFGSVTPLETVLKCDTLGN
ncbi:MAG: hypothetical protein H7336_08295 [Bacteriovorax sp.]|nr:hypothetical protein [Bacteriovorax sp.]